MRETFLENLNLNKMYKEFILTKRYSIAFNRFPKTAKNPPYHEAYITGYHRKTDEINGFTTHFFVLGRFRVMWYVKHKNPTGTFCG